MKFTIYVHNMFKNAFELSKSSVVRKLLLLLLHIIIIIYVAIFRHVMDSRALFKHLPVIFIMFSFIGDHHILYPAFCCFCDSFSLGRTRRQPCSL